MARLNELEGGIIGAGERAYAAQETSCLTGEWRAGSGRAGEDGADDGWAIEMMLLVLAGSVPRGEGRPGHTGLWLFALLSVFSAGCAENLLDSLTDSARARKSFGQKGTADRFPALLGWAGSEGLPRRVPQGEIGPSEWRAEKEGQRGRVGQRRGSSAPVPLATLSLGLFSGMAGRHRS